MHTIRNQRRFIKVKGIPLSLFCFPGKKLDIASLSFAVILFSFLVSFFTFLIRVLLVVCPTPLLLYHFQSQSFECIKLHFYNFGRKKIDISSI